MERDLIVGGGALCAVILTLIQNALERRRLANFLDGMDRSKITSERLDRTLRELDLRFSQLPASSFKDLLIDMRGACRGTEKLVEQHGRKDTAGRMSWDCQMHDAEREKLDKILHTQERILDRMDRGGRGP